jgi:hypothetical protein
LAADETNGGRRDKRQPNLAADEKPDKERIRI